MPDFWRYSLPPNKRKQNAPLDNGATNTSAGQLFNVLTTMIAQLQPISTKQLSADGFHWNQYSPRIATITDELRYFATVAYFQFFIWSSAHAFWQSITSKRYCTRAQVRKAERFDNGFEVKVWGMPESVLEKLIERDRARQPKSLPLPTIRRDWRKSDSYSALAIEAA
jgi:hypothetical protein